MEFELLPEEHLAEAMRETVEPWLAGRRTTGTTGDGLYYECYDLPRARGTVVISHGSTENCEKFRELTYYFLRQGYRCALLDHRGHGRSPREGKHEKIVHISDFQRYVDEFHRFVAERAVPLPAGSPLVLYAHSMGGCIGALDLEQHPADFAAAILNAPMLGLDTGGIPAFAGKAICAVMKRLGKAEEKLWFQGDFDPNTPFADDACTSPARSAYYLDIRRQTPAYQLSASSYGWTATALRATKAAVENAKKIAAPVLLFQAEQDGFVDPKAQEKFVGKLRNGELVRVAGGKHEIYRSGNGVLEGYFEKIFDFLEKSVPGEDLQVMN